MIDVSVLVDKLNQMTGLEIGDFLFHQGVQGSVQDEYECPIAHWIQRESGRWVSVGCQIKTADRKLEFGVRVHADSEDQYVAEYLISDGPKEFIGQFDNGAYPQLETPIEAYE